MPEYIITRTRSYRVKTPDDCPDPESEAIKIVNREINGAPFGPPPGFDCVPLRHDTEVRMP